MKRVVFVAWQSPKDRRWFPVGRLTFDGSSYRFVYTKGTRKASEFIPFSRMQDLECVYESTELFPVFANRLLGKDRPEYRDFLQWLAVPESEGDPLALLERTGGPRETDSLTIFPRPERTALGTYESKFFVQGIRYLPSHAIDVVNKLSPGMRLYLMPDPQNRYDHLAIGLRTEDPKTLVGYCPRYFAEDFLALLEHNGAADVLVSVHQVNRAAPIQLRLLCQIVAPWPENFQPCAGELYEPLARTPREIAAGQT